MLDFFAGSGTTGAAAGGLKRRFVMIDDSPEAYETIRERLGGGCLPGPIDYIDLTAARLAGHGVA